MCGRFATAFLTPEKLIRHFGLALCAELPVRYNLAPTQTIPAIRQLDQQRTLSLLHWGLIPHWAKERLPNLHTFNARAETLSQKPTFRDPFKHQRCLIPASGFYEWQVQGEGKQPYYIFRHDRTPLAFAGLWDHWLDPASGETIESCAIITVPANAQMAAIHERMPAILEPEHFATWLDPAFKETHILHDLLELRPEVLAMYPVSAFVNNSHHEGPDCIDPVSVNPQPSEDS